ncbi:DUF4055 domain-containing protein [Pusillimonas sp. NJUB218]|uniref:DUF4055 domain-containing protein n=1 Tax=Pusillimonas sp. NJUB218 TaxID=2023230 RepID=UPI000F4CE1AA|nr:DUF4055 domain-containing protein [Pusillimonas sp. NJUB218]ROT45015.1 hypothetical protein CHR62_09190 [Pusillimonas sp. NJUB218]
MADISTPLPAYEAMLSDWQLIDALKGGTRAMRAAGKAYLPQWPAEDDEDYKIRLGSAVLYPALAQTVENMVGRVFMRPIVLGESIPEVIRQQTADFDLQGSRLDIVAADWFDEALTYGLSHLLIDYPSVEEQPRNLAEERQSGSRPYATVINPKQVIGWKSARINGVEKLTQVRIKETVQEDDGDFGVASVEQIRVLRRGSWQVYRAAENGGWLLFDEGLMSVPDIPLVTLYTNRTGFMTATPPLIHLANLNIKHWQQQSEQDTNLHIARNPILFLTGIEEGEIKFGSRYALTSNHPEAKGSYIEHTGAAIAAGRLALEDLKDEMREAGARLLKKGQAAAKTATESRDDSINEQSQLGRMAQALEDAVDLALQYMAAWQGIEQDAGAVAVNDDFDIEVISDQSVQSLVQMAAAGQLSTQTLFSELQRRGVLSDDLDWEAEQERIAAGALTEVA